jgi:hypothetical protein
MLNLTDLASVPSGPLAPFTDRLRLAVAAYLARLKGSSRNRTESDLRCYLTWCAERRLDPLAAQRPHLELYIRWMQEIRRFKPSTVSRRFSVAAGFYATCALDGVLPHSPAARESASSCDFALVAMLGLLGLRIFEATSANDDAVHQVGPAPTSTGTPTTSWPPTCPQRLDQPASPRLEPRGDALHCRIEGVASLCTYMPDCMPLTVAVIVKFSIVIRIGRADRSGWPSR